MGDRQVTSVSDLLTSAQVAERLGVTVQYARRLIAAHPDAERIGPMRVLPEAALPDLVARDTKRGRRWHRRGDE